MIGEGMALGILESESLVEDAMNDLEATATSDIGIDSSFGNYTPMTPNVNEDKRSFTINVYPSEGMDERALAEKVNEIIARWARNEEIVYA